MKKQILTARTCMSMGGRHCLQTKGDAVKKMLLAVLTAVLVWTVLLTGRGTEVQLLRMAGDCRLSFSVDGLSSLFAGLVSLMWPAVLPYAFSYMREEERQTAFFSFYLMTFGITLGVAFSANLLSMYVFYELLSLVTIPLVTHYGNHESMMAGRVYAAYTIGGASLGLLAVAMTVIAGGSASFRYGGSVENCGSALQQTAFLLGFFGFGVKAAVFPLSRWLPTASAAPTPVTALLHAVAVVNAGVFAIARLSRYVFAPEELLGTTAQTICLAAAEFTLVWAALQAVRETHFKRRLAWSTVSNLSYMLYGLMLLTPEGLTAGLSHMVFHGVIKIVLFMCAGAFMHRTGKNYIFELTGIGRKMPATFLCYTLSALSLTGIPLFAGFVSKWQLFTAGAAAGTGLAAAGVCALVVSAFLCAIYTLTVSVRAFFPAAGRDRFGADSPVREAESEMLSPIVLFTAADVLLGLFPGPVLHFLEMISGGMI